MIIFLGNGETHKLYDSIIKESKSDNDIVVSCQYPYLVPESLLESHTCVNIHYGTLPFYAGCNPIYWQIMTSDRAGVTLHYMDKSFDGGDIIDIWECPIGIMTASELYKVLEWQGLQLLKKHYKGIVEGTAPRKPQDKAFRRYFHKSDIDFNKSKNVPYALANREVRANHFPGKQLPVVTIGGRKYELRSC